MVKISIAPLSVNQAYRGRRFATPELKAYKTAVAYSLPKKKIPEGKLRIDYEFGFSSSRSDLDNAVKICQDSIAEFYGFNDNRIYEIRAVKKITKKGKEYVAFEIKPCA